MRKIAAMMIVALALASAAMAQTGTDPERLTLAQEVVEAVLPLEMEEQRAVRAARALEPMSTLFAGFSEGGPSFDDVQLRASLAVGVRAVQAARREALTRIIQTDVTTQHQRQIIAFARSGEGRAAMRAYADYEQRTERWIERVRQNPGQVSSSLANEPPIYTPTAAERGFNATPAGEASRRAMESVAFIPGVAQSAGLAAQSDYCSHAVCTDAHREFFANIFTVFMSDPASREHTMSGLTAAEAFTNEIDAALVRAACDGDAQGVVDAVARGANPDAVGGNAAEYTSVTPLAWALGCFNVVGFEALLTAGANPNFVGPMGSTPVTLAASERNPEYLRLLLAHGGDANAHHGRQTALEIALVNENGLDLVDHLPLDQVRANWNALLAAGADPDRVAPDGDPLIITAAYNNHWRYVEWLVGRGWNGDWALLGRISQMSVGVDGVPPDERSALRRVLRSIEAHGVRLPIER